MYLLPHMLSSQRTDLGMKTTLSPGVQRGQGWVPEEGEYLSQNAANQILPARNWEFGLAQAPSRNRMTHSTGHQRNLIKEPLTKACVELRGQWGILGQVREGSHQQEGVSRPHPKLSHRWKISAPPCLAEPSPANADWLSVLPSLAREPDWCHWWKSTSLDTE
jgi:hypothetical protein